jgi:predicted transposase/invertase (TIGR01784 family)
MIHKKPGKQAEKFIPPLSDYIVRAIFGDQKNIAITAAFLRLFVDIPPEDYEEIRVVSPVLFRRWNRDKEGILDIKLVTKSGRIIHIEIQINPFKAMISRILYYQARLIADQIHSGEDFDRIHQVISVVILDHGLLPRRKEYLNIFELCNLKPLEVEAGEAEILKQLVPEPFTDLQKIVIIELSKLPVEDDGTALWPHLRFFTCKSEEEMAMLATKHPEVKKTVEKYYRLTLLDEIRWFIDDINDARRVRRMREAYVRDEGYNQAAAEYQEKLSAKDEQIRQLEEEIHHLRGE